MINTFDVFEGVVLQVCSQDEGEHDYIPELLATGNKGVL